MSLPSAQHAVLLSLARSAIEARLGGPPLEPPSAPWLQEPRGVFVTLRRGSRLHGCMGTIEAIRPLGLAVARNAVLAAFEDPRSRPLRYPELDEVRIEVSILGEPQRLAAASEAEAIAKLEPFVDGVILSFGRFQGVFLPQVWRTMPEPHAFLRALNQKAGLPAAFWDPKVELSRFRVEKFSEAGYGAE